MASSTRSDIGSSESLTLRSGLTCSASSPINPTSSITSGGVRRAARLPPESPAVTRAGANTRVAGPRSGRPVRAQLLSDEAQKIVAALWRRPFAAGIHCFRLGRIGNAGAKPRAAEIDGKDRAHPFTPELTTESTKKRCRMTNSSTGGSTASVAPAITSPVFMAPRL